jgi:uncharacterized protein YecE (DUF72 family)
MSVAVGTCGFSYKDWIGPVYPPGTKPADMLPLYAETFTIVEIDSTYYGVPAPATVESWARRTPDDFRFTAKLPGTATHVPKPALGTIHDDVRLFRANLQPLVAARKLACALLQFPNGFRPGGDAERHLRALRDALDGIPLVAEFRHRDWQTNDTLVLLRELGIGLVAVDEPQYKSLPRPSADATSDIAYVRFHGRNYEQWWKGDNVTRYDYLYTAEELGPWADRLVDLASHQTVKEVLAFFNNHRRGQAARNAKMFEAMLATRFPREAIRKAIRELPAEREREPEAPRLIEG